MPPSLLRAVCTIESGLRANGALCGVRRPRWRELAGASATSASAHYPDADQARRAASALVRWRGRCGSWAGALQMFHTGSTCSVSICAQHTHRRPYAIEVLAIARGLGFEEERP